MEKSIEYNRSTTPPFPSNNNDSDQNENETKLWIALKCSLWNDETRKIRIRTCDLKAWHYDRCQRTYKIDERIRAEEASVESFEKHNLICECLHSYLTFQIREWLRKDKQLGSVETPSSIKIEAYDQKLFKFVSLLQNDIRNLDAATYFGKRIQCVASLMDDTQSQLMRPAIMGRFFPFHPQQGIDFAGGKLLLHEVANNQINATGLNIWDGALLMVKYLENCPIRVTSKQVLELGAGCGTAGIAAGILGAKQVVLTDLPYALSVMETNVEKNISRIEASDYQQIDCKACDWFNPPPLSTFHFQSTEEEEDGCYGLHPNVILLADCVWLEELVPPLFQTIEKYSCSQTNVIITYQRRGKTTHTSFFKHLYSTFGTVEKIDTNQYGFSIPEYLYLFLCHK